MQRGVSQCFEGQCQCGDVRYRLSGVPLTLFACHCTECQRQSSSAFGMALWIADPEVQTLTGELRKWIRHLPSGDDMECSFCATCGTRLFHQIVGQPGRLSLKPGTLCEANLLRPVAHIWTESMHTWIGLNDSIQYPRNPPSFETFFSLWAEATG